ncbi:MAG TPA: metallopeptidase family protein [Chthoniobacterales bacterium]|nr:metallopeptidase family protein [Chthoniobacterales bacterium]
MKICLISPIGYFYSMHSFKAHGKPIIDWEELAQSQVEAIQNELPEPIRSCAMEVPVFFHLARNGRASRWLGLFEGCSLLAGTPVVPDELPRITLFIDNLAKAANYERATFLREVRTTYLHELGHYLGWDERQIANIGLA